MTRLLGMGALLLVCSACTPATRPSAAPVVYEPPSTAQGDAAKASIPDAVPPPVIRSYRAGSVPEHNSFRSLHYGTMAGNMFGLAGRCGVDRGRIERDMDRARRYAQASLQPIESDAFDAAMMQGMQEWTHHPFSNPDYYCRDVERDLASQEAALARAGQ